MKSKKTIFVLVCSAFLFVLPLTLLGCAKEQTDEMTLETYARLVDCSYDEVYDETRVVWETTIKNDSLYDIAEFSVKFKLYNDGKQIDTKTYHYDKQIGIGGEYRGQLAFVEKGRVTGIEFVSWEAKQADFWGTYKLWVIIAGAVSLLGAVIYIILTVVNDTELWEVVDGIVDFAWIPLSVLFLICGT